MTQPFRLSPSAIDKFDRCPTLWRLAYVDKATEARGSDDNMALGSFYHKLLESLITGDVSKVLPKDYQLRLMLKEGALKAVPNSGIGFEAETELKGVFEGFDCIGYVDFWRYDKTTGNLWVGDWKTSSKLNYAKTTEELAALVQPNFYAWLLIASGRCPEPKSITFQHVTIATDIKFRGMYKSTLAHTSYSAVCEFMYSRVLPIANRMVEAASPGGRCATNTSACWDYGFCRYGLHCDKAPRGVQKRCAEATGLKPQPKLRIEVNVEVQGFTPAPKPATTGIFRPPVMPSTPKPMESLKPAAPKTSPQMTLFKPPPMPEDKLKPVAWRGIPKA